MFYSVMNILIAKPGSQESADPLVPFLVIGGGVRVHDRGDAGAAAERVRRGPRPDHGQRGMTSSRRSHHATIRICRASFSSSLAAPAFADDSDSPRPSPGKGELKYVNGIPVLTVEGTPEEIGTQFGELALKPAKKPLLGRVDSYMKQIGWEKQFPTMVKFSRAGVRERSRRTTRRK